MVAILNTNFLFICKNKPLGWKYRFIYTLLFDSSLMAEEREEKADLKAQMAAPPLTPQQTVLCARWDRSFFLVHFHG